MKKLLFIFAMLVSLVFNLSAQHTNPGALVNEFQSVRSSVKNWNSVPGSENEKRLAIVLEEPIQVQDSAATVRHNWNGFFIWKKLNYHRLISYDRTDATFSTKEVLYKESLDPYWFVLLGLALSALLILIQNSRKGKIQKSDFLASFLLMIFSYYLGILCIVISLFYRFRDRIRNLK